MAALPFGCLVARNVTTGQENHLNLENHRDICIGRALPPFCQFNLPEKIVSNMHLRVYAVGYQSGGYEDVGPLVYAQNLSRNGTLLSRYRDDASPGRIYSPLRLHQFSPPVLLHHKDQLDVGSDWSFTYIIQHYKSPPIAIRSSDEQQSREMKEFDHIYTVSRRKIGEGEHSQVFLAYDRCQGRQVACKIVRKGLDGQIPRKLAGSRDLLVLKSGLGTQLNDHVDDLRSHEAKMSTHQVFIRPKAAVKLIREVDILQHICHPNIIHLEHVFVSETTTYIFQKLVAGGDLLSYVKHRGGNLCEAEAAFIVRQILEALKYLHENKVVHRDLKPENILMASLSQGARVVLADFSSAKFFEQTADDQKPETFTEPCSQVGTEAYAPPETLNAQKARECSGMMDLWSLGAVTANILTGMHPFLTAGSLINSKASISKMQEDSKDFMETTHDWRRISLRAKSFIRGLLVHEAARMTASEALKDEWLTNISYSKELNALYNRAIEDWQNDQKSRKFPIQILRGSPPDIPIISSPDCKDLVNLVDSQTTKIGQSVSADDTDPGKGIR